MKSKKTYDVREYLNLRDVHFDDKGFPIPYKGVISEMKVNNRPMTEILEPNISLMNQKEKTIIHNYGHAAHGWTLLFGSVLNAVELFENDLIKKNIDLEKFKKSEEIVVLGYGCIGLTTTLILNNKGYKKIKMIGEQKDLITSHTAGGGFNTVAYQVITDENIKKRLNNMVLNSFLIYKLILENNHPFSNFLKDCVEWMDFVTTDWFGQGIGLYHLAELGLVPKPEDCDIIYGSSENSIKIQNKHWVYQTFLIHTERYCVNSFKKIKELGVQCELKRINSFDEVDQKYVFNCTALGSIVINNDKKAFPCAGHGIILKNQPLEMKNERPPFCFTSLDIPCLKDSPNKGTIYLFPKENNIFLGGTGMMNYDGSDDSKNKEEWKRLILRSRLVFHGIPENVIKQTKF
jgi:hypothetical protein